MINELLVVTGSHAYGCVTEESDVDTVSIVVPDYGVLFPPIIHGFDQWQDKFEQSQSHTEEYDTTLYSIVKFFALARDNNPNIIDILYTPDDCIKECTDIGGMLISNRHLFLHKGLFYRFSGYAYSQMNKIRTKKPEGKRAEIVRKYGYDIKFAYHLVRLMCEAEQLLGYGTMDLRAHADTYRDIRNGLWLKSDVEDFFHRKESKLKALYDISPLPDRPRPEIRELLVECLIKKYGEERCQNFK